MLDENLQALFYLNLSDMLNNFITYSLQLPINLVYNHLTIKPDLTGGVLAANIKE